MVVAAAHDVVVGLAVGIPVLVVAVGAGVALRFRGRGPASTVPPGEVAADVPTGAELAAGAEATRVAEAEPAAREGAEPAPSPAGAAPVPGAEAPAAEVLPEEAPEAAALPEEAPTYRGRLGKARGLLAGYLGAVRSRGKIDATTWDDLEEALIRADVGVGATDAILDDLRARVKANEIAGPDALLDALRADLAAALDAPDRTLAPMGSARAGSDDGDRSVDVWLFVGVNGVGKTTTLGKVATRLTAGGASVVLAAGDTFRAAAGEQLALWASRSGSEIVRGAEGGDPSSVVYDAVQRAAARQADIVLADTAGRLHNKANLIEELKKIRRVSDRAPGRVTEVLLVIDATTGQNGLAQAAVFTEAVDVTGVVLTKLDGTAKGGIVVAIQRELGLPVKLVGLGEGPGDLVDFDPVSFVDALF